MVCIFLNSKQRFSKILESIKTTEDALFKHTTTNDSFFLQMPKCLKKPLHTTRAVKTCWNGQTRCNFDLTKHFFFINTAKVQVQKKKSHIYESLRSTALKHLHIAHQLWGALWESAAYAILKILTKTTCYLNFCCLHLLAALKIWSGI